MTHTVQSSTVSAAGGIASTFEKATPEALASRLDLAQSSTRCTRAFGDDDAASDQRPDRALEVRRFHVAFPRCWTRRGLAEARAGVARFEDWIGGPINGHEQLKWRTMPHLLMPWAARLSCNPGVLDPVRDLLGPDVLLFTGTFFIKEPNSPTIAAWHRIRPTTASRRRRSSPSGSHCRTPARRPAAWKRSRSRENPASCSKNRGSSPIRSIAQRK